MRHSFISQRRIVFGLVLLVAVNSALSQEQSAGSVNQHSQLELARPVRPWEFIDAVGQRAAFFGRESGEMEGWVYPRKVCRGFQLRFHTVNGALPAAELARQLIVHPDGPAIVYSSASFQVRETFLVPPTEPGAIIRLDIDTF